MRQQVLLFDGHRHLTVEYDPPRISLQYAVTGLASPTLRRIQEVGPYPEPGVNPGDAYLAILGEIERREHNATFFERAVAAARDVHARRAGVELEPPITNYGRTK